MANDFDSQVHSVQMEADAFFLDHEWKNPYELKVDGMNQTLFLEIKAKLPEEIEIG